MALELHIHSPPEGPLSLFGITPDHLAGLSQREIGELPVFGSEPGLRLGDVARVTGSLDDGVLRFVGTNDRLHDVGAWMKSGQIEVEGALGRGAGAGMTGGRLLVRGSVGDDLGLEMRDGTIEVFGSAGNRTGGGQPGNKVGMRGGMVLIHGDCGSQAAGKLRGGLVAIAGSAAEALANDCRAGTVLVLGHVGEQPGRGMRRGTLLLPQETAERLPLGFRPGRPFSPPFLPLIAHQLKACNFPLPPGFDRATCPMYHGDFLAFGRGEIFLHPATT